MPQKIGEAGSACYAMYICGQIKLLNYSVTTGCSSGDGNYSIDAKKTGAIVLKEAFKKTYSIDPCKKAASVASISDPCVMFINFNGTGASIGLNRNLEYENNVFMCIPEFVLESEVGNNTAMVIIPEGATI